VPAIWLPTPQLRADRELARWRLHLVRHRVALKNRIHVILIAFGHPCSVSDLFGVGALVAFVPLPLPLLRARAARKRGVDGSQRAEPGSGRDLRQRHAGSGLVDCSAQPQYPRQPQRPVAEDGQAPLVQVSGAEPESFSDPSYRPRLPPS
jgi:hypothetical protein